MKNIFRLSITVLLIISLFVLSACKGNGKEIDVPIDSSSNIQTPSNSDDVSSENIQTDNDILDDEIQTGQDVIIDMGEEFFE